jgi:hypothetical protein
MNTKVKELIDEFIDYRKNRKPLKYLHNAYDTLGDKEFVSLIGWLLQWQKETTLGWKELTKFEIDDVWHKQFSKFFESCPELNEVFSLKKDHIGWAASISDEEKIEIRDYIHENYKIEVRARVNRGKTEE